MKRGPKPRHEDEKRSARFELRLLPAELERIATAASELGQGISDFIRSSALRAAGALGRRKQREAGRKLSPPA